MNEHVDFDELAHYAEQLGYRDTELIANRLARMIVRNHAYLLRRRTRGMHTSHDDTTAEDMAVIDQVLKGRRKDFRGVPSVRALAKEIMQSIHSGKPLADILELDPTEFEQKAVDLVRDPAPAPGQKRVPDRGRKRVQKKDEGKDGRLKGEMPRIRKNVMFAEDVAEFLESMKAPNQRTFIEGGYSGFLERLVRESQEYQEYQASHQNQSRPELE